MSMESLPSTSLQIRKRISELFILPALLMPFLILGMLNIALPISAEEPTVPLQASQKESPKKAETVSSATSRYVRKKIHDPNGIGKFYMGREIAHVMGYLGASWLERGSREEEERLSLLVKALELKSGMAVADIGAGSGVITALMAPKVLPKGQIFAVDVQKQMLTLLKRKMKKLGINNVVPVLGTAKSTTLKRNSIDVALFVDVYHELEFPYEMMLEISQAMKPGGRVVLVEYRKEDPRVPIKEVHKMSQKQVKKELTLPEFQLKWKETINVLPRQHIVIFQKLDPTKQNKGKQNKEQD